MFDINNIPENLIKAKEELDNANAIYFNKMSSISADDMKSYKRLEKEEGSKVIQAEKKFAKLHDKYCDDIGMPNQKITEKWKQWW